MTVVWVKQPESLPSFPVLRRRAAHHILRTLIFFLVPAPLSPISQIAAPVDQSLIVPPPGEEGNWSRLSPFIRYAMLAAEEALHHARWCPSTPSEKERSGVYIGTGIGCLDEIVEANRVIHSGGGVRRLSPHFVPKILGNLATGNVSIRHGLQGPNHASITACASGAHAVGDAFRMIQFGDADVMVAGGTEACINAISLGGFSRLRALSTKYNNAPHQASRPFDSRRDGFVMGEGAAVLVLEEREHARARGARALAEVIGYGMAGDAHHITAPSPDGGGAFRAMRSALKNASMAGRRGEGGREGVRMGEVDYVNAHATSTPVGDTIEGNAIQRLLIEHRKEEGERGGIEEKQKKRMYVSSTKGATGHLLGAAGALEAAFTVLALRDGVVPGTANLERCVF